MMQSAEHQNKGESLSPAETIAGLRKLLSEERAFSSRKNAELAAMVKNRDKLAASLDELKGMLPFIASVVEAEPEPNSRLEEFRKLLDEDYQTYANQNASSSSSARAMKTLQEVGAQLKMAARDSQILGKSIVAIGGAFSCGKSSFISSLFRQGSLPVDMGQTTAIASYVMNGETTEITGYTYSGGRVQIPDGIFSRLTYGHEDEFGFNMKRVIDDIVFRTQFIRPYSNICFVDTPGFDPGYSSDLDQSTSVTAIAVAQALLWCFDINGGTIHEADFRFLRDVLDVNPGIRIYIIANKANLNTDEANASVLEQAEMQLKAYSIKYEGISLYDATQKFCSQPEEYASYVKGKSLNDFLDENNSPDTRKEAELLKLVSGVFDEYIKADDEEIQRSEKRIQDLKSLRSRYKNILNKKDDVIDDLKSRLSNKDLQSIWSKSKNETDETDETEDDWDTVHQIIGDSIKDLKASETKAIDDKAAAEKLCRKFERCIRGIFGDRKVRSDAQRSGSAESRACETEDAGELYELGEKYCSAKDYGNAFRMLRKAADKGFAKAQNSFGLLYLNGYGVNQNYAVAMKWFRKAADQGDSDAMNNLGNMHYNGQGVDQNYDEALKWYKKSVAQGNADAQLILGNMYYNGQGVVQSYATALVWYRLSAEHGNAVAQSCLGNMYHDGQGVEKNWSEAFKWYKKSAEQGNADAQLSLGNMYQDGTGTAQNSTEALVWYMKSAEQGNAEAQLSLGNMYYNSENYTQAVLWYQKSAGQGNADAQYRLGRMYENGEGVNKNYAEAFEWYQKSADQGNSDASAKMGDADALYRVGKMYYEGQGVEQDYPEAFRWFKKSAELGNADAQCQVSLMYGFGQGVERDNDEALKWLGKANSHKKSPNDLSYL